MALINVQNADGSVSQVDDSQVSIQPVQKAGAVRSLGDTLLKFGRGAAGATKAGLDAFGANNALSQGAGKVADFLQSGLSDEAIANDMIAAQRTKAAEGKGAMAEIGATLRNFAANPIDTFAEGAGSIVPTAAAMIASRGRVNPSAVGVGLGAAQGAGAVKGSIYDAVKQDATAKGYNEEQANQLADDAQAYNGQNRDQIALGAGLGVVAGKVGAESTGLLTGQARQSATSLLRDTLKGVAVEGGTEAAQGGQERFAANTALNRLGADVDQMAGVYGQAAAEGIAGGLTGGAFNAADTITSRREQFKQTLLEQGGGGAISQAAVTAVDTGAAQPALGLPNYAGEPMVTFPDGTTMTQAEARARYTQQEIDAFNTRVGNNQPTQIAGALPNKDIDPMIVFADGSTGKKSDFDNYINSLPTESERMAARAKFMGYAPQPADAPLPTLEDLPENTGAMLPNKDLDPMIVYPDGSAGKRSEFDAYINNLPERQRVTEMARLLGYGQQEGASDTQQPATKVAAQGGKEELANAQAGAGNELSATGRGSGLGADAATPSPSMRSDIPAGAQPRAGANAGNAAAGAYVEQFGNAELLPTAEQSSVVEPTIKDSLTVQSSNPSSNPQDTRQVTNELPVESPASNPPNNDIRANDAATSVFNELPEPTQAQKDAGNYKLGRMKVGGLDVSVENPDQSTRKGTDPDGTPWESVTNGHYGYIKGVVARSPDKQHVDVNVKHGTGADFSGDVFIVNQNDPRTGKFDEPKVYMGYADEAEAEGAYRSNYTPDWKGFGSIVRVPFERFKQMLNDEQAFMQPVRPTLRQQIESRKSITKEETESLFGLPAKREKALKRIAEGRGWFGNEAKAKEFVRVNGLSETHKAVKGKGLRWDILENKQDSAFHVLSVNNATGAVTRMTSTPVTESEGNTIISKNAEREGRTLKLEPVKEGGAVDISSAMANAVSVDNLSNDQLDQVASILGINSEVQSKRADEALISQSEPSKKLENATAPEHVSTEDDQGVTVDELRQIAKAWRSEIDAGRDAEITHIFDSPAKGEVVRLNDKVKVYTEANGWMTPAEAKQKISEWKQHVKDQANNPDARRLNSDKVVLSFFDLSGEWSKPWEEAGYQVYRFDIQDDPDMGDVNNFSTEFFQDWFGDFEGQDIHAILAACPCTDFAVSGARHFAAKDADGRTVSSVRLVKKTLAAIEYFKPSVWALENPVGRIEDLTGLPPWRLSFDPNHLGDPYTKKTLIWGRFNGDLPIAPVEPTEGSKMHKLYGGKSQATKNARSVTPEGFSYGFFMANNAYDNLAMTIANKYDRLDANLIGRAVEAGVTEEEISNAVDDFYYMDLDDNAANKAINELISESSPTEPTGIKPDSQFSGNKVFTADKVEAARARLKSKLGTLNSGIDPELLIDGMTIAGAYIESGVRSFADYAKAMTADFGDSIKPYLLSFYEAARAYPGIDKEGMSSADDASKQYQSLITPAVAEKAKEAIGTVEKKKTTRKVKSAPDDKYGFQLNQDWRVGSINGYGDEDVTAGYTDLTFSDTGGANGGVKDAFIADSKKYLNNLASIMQENGYTPHLDKKGKPEKPVTVNEGGPAVSGDITLTITKGKANVYVHISEGALRGLTSSHPQGVSIMVRVSTKNADKFATGSQNNWINTTLSVGEVYNRIDSMVERALFGVQNQNDYVKTTEPTNEGTTNARATQAGAVPDRTAQNDLFSEQPGRSDSKPVATRVAAASEEAAGNESVRGSVQEPSRNGAQGAIGNDRDGAPSAAREAGNAGNKPSATGSVDNFEITDDVGLGEGGLTRKFKDNVDAIKLIKALESEGRQATPEERIKLAKYVGFGALKGVFDKANKQWAKQYQELKDLLTDQEYESARASVLNAHYTSKEIVNSIYSGIERLGFKGGRVLEPSLGSGNFFGLMPSSMRNKSQLSGVELDLLTSRLAKQLYPKASIAVATGFQDYAAPSGYFDAVIGNPPFGSERIFDNQKSPYSGFSIHNYFLAKSIDKLRDGGVLAVVVSHNFMDVNASPARDYIAKHANLIGAIRLPDTAFQQNAGTEVVTDIVFFQKTDTPEKNPAWVNSTEIDITNTKTGEVAKAFVNDYFLANPRMVLGRQSAAGTMYRGNSYTVEQTGDVAKLLKEAIQSLPENIYVEPTQRIEVLDSADNTVPDGVKVGTYFTDESGVIRQRLTDLLGQKRSQAWEAPNNGAIERMKGMMKLRDVLRDQMRLERSPDADTKQIEKNRQQLNKLYDDFQKKYGYLNSVTNRRIFLDDTESSLLQALEMDYDQGVSKVKASSTGMEERPASATKADIFKQRVLFPPSETISVSNAKDALLASLNEKGRVDMDFISDVYGKSIEEALKELGDVVFDDPQSGYVMADEYLSGDVKTKLNEAKAAAKDDSKFKRNVEALEKVIPKDKLPSEIYVSVGANFVPTDVYTEFASEITGIPADKVNFTYVKATANWLSANNGTGDAGKLSADFGTEKVNSFDLFAMMLNGKSPEIKYTVRLPGGGTETRTDVEGTEAARAKYQKIKDTWESWLFSDPSRAERIAEIYNDKHNRIVPRKFDGSHMTFPGMNPAITLRPSQKNVVWRGIQDRNVLLDHVVGAGKTMAMATIAMEMKRLGISRKPLFVVPNHLTLQWRSEFTSLYPASNILAATPEDFSKDKRERLFSKMVTGSYDAIIIGHSSLKKVGLPPEVEEKLYNDQINEIANAIEQMKRERGDRSIIRDMEKIKTTLENKVKDLVSKAGKKDDVVNFDEIGIDALFVDEMHEFKNLFFTTQMQRVSGLGNPKGSGKAFDMFMKVRWMGETFGDNAALITATGTPVSNSLSEMFTMQRYHKYDQMKRDDLHLFDAWSKQYGEVENLYEVAPSGVGYRQSTRFSKFKNLPSLMGSYTSFADIVTLQDLKDNATAEGDTFPVPKLRSGKPINVVAERSELQTNFFGVPQLATDDAGNIQFELEPEDVDIQPVEDKWQMFNKKNSVLFGDKYATKEDAELDLVTKALTPKTFLDPKSLLGKFANLRQLTRETKGKVNALSLTGLANKCGLDYRLIDAAAPDYKGSKINKAVDNMLGDYKLWSKDKGAQIIFCDMSIPLSARNDMGSKEKRVYVRDRDDSITHKPKGVIYAPEGFEGFPFYLVKERDGFDIYEPVSGQQITTRRFSDKAEAKAYINSMVESDSFADRIYGMRDRMSMEQTEIDEYRESKELEVADDFSNEITLADLEAVAGSAQFSVYDDIRAKLIDRGVPEAEIAFIHDFNTPKQKEDLFKRVNRGDVRFLFGSTPKLGAGTNVQQRLVALHHIDAPWRPSDLEQREGRIIRQKNKLYERDPEGFEVAIYRYATEQTYDTRRWQLLEHKASGIEQLRKYTGESEIEDVSSEAANSADMKAAASGNPLILEETQLRTEKKRLENLQRAFNDSKFAMQQRITSNKKAAEVTLPQRIAHYAEMKRVSDQYPVPEDKEAVAVFNIDGRNITSKEKAEESLSAMAARVRQSYNEREEKTFTYRGIEFTMSRGWDLGMLDLSSQDSNIATYLSKDGISPSGMITRLNNYISSFNDRIARFENEAQKAKNEADQLASRLNDPFEQAGELDSVRQKHVEIQRKLMKSTQLDAIPKSQLGEFKRIIESRKADLRKLGFSDAVRESERDAPAFSRTQRTNLATQSELEEVAKLIAGLESDKPLRKSIAERKVQMHPMSDAIKQVSTDFYDIIEQLEDAGLIKINC